jgi:flagellar export protein FliJ
MFQFRLASVLRYRERIKEEKQWKLRSLNEARRKIAEEVRLLEEELRGTEEALMGQEGRIYPAKELRLYGDHLFRLASCIREKQSVLTGLEQKLDETRAELIEALRLVKTLEQLRKRLEKKFYRQQEIAERKATDEVSHRRFICRGGERQKLP